MPGQRGKRQELPGQPGAPAEPGSAQICPHGPGGLRIRQKPAAPSLAKGAAGAAAFLAGRRLSGPGASGGVDPGRSSAGPAPASAAQDYLAGHHPRRLSKGAPQKEERMKPIVYRIALMVLGV